MFPKPIKIMFQQYKSGTNQTLNVVRVADWFYLEEYIAIIHPIYGQVGEVYG